MSFPLIKLSEVAPISPHEGGLSEQKDYWLLNLDQIEANSGHVFSKLRVGLDEIGSSTHAFGPQHVLFSKLRPNLNKVVVPEEYGFCTSELVPLLPDKDRLDRDYLAFYLRSPDFVNWAVGKTAGAKMPRLSMKLFGEQTILLPPLATQRHIAKMLEQADYLRRQARQMRRELQGLRRSVFLSSVGPRAEEYGSWKFMEVSDLASADKNSMRTGPFGSALKHSEFVDSGIAVIGIDNAVSDQFQWKERRYISVEKYQSLKKYRVFPGDVIVTIMGTTGRSAVVPDDVPLAISTKHLATITLDLERATPEFLKYAIQYHPLIAEQVAAQNKGAVMDGLNLGIIKKLKLPVPPLAIQQNLSRAMKALDTESETLAKNTEHFEQLFNVLTQRAFKGELIPKLA